MYRQEGVLSYWKGILPPILIETPKRATKFVCFEQYKQFFMFGADKPTPLVCVDIELKMKQCMHGTLRMSHGTQRSFPLDIQIVTPRN